MKLASNNILKLLLSLAALLTVSTALAHTDLTRSVPAADAKLDQSPDSITLEYGDAVKLIRVQLQTPTGDKVALPLDRASPPAKVTTIAIAEPLATGSYKVLWSAIGEDGHIMTGEFGFSIV